MTRPHALVFDFGNVVAHFDYGRAADRFGRRLGIPGEEFARRAMGAGFVELLKAYESGRLTSPEFHRLFCERTGVDCDFDDFARDWRDIFWANDPVHRLIDGLRGLGYTLVLGSNTNELQAIHFRGQFAETLGHFDRLVLSYEVGHIKPAAEFYLACAEAAGRAPGECVFIDDLAENVEGANRAGLIGVLFCTAPRLVADLRALGVEVPSCLDD